MTEITLAERVHAWRSYVGRTITEVATELGISRAAIYAWEAGDADPTQENLAKLADTFGISLAVFWGAIPGKPEAS